MKAFPQILYYSQHKTTRLRMPPRPSTVWQAARKGEDAVIAAALASEDDEVHASLLKGSPSDEEQRSPAHLAAEFGHVGCLRLLLPVASKVRDRAGRTPLHAAAAGAKPVETLAVLLDEGIVGGSSSGLDVACAERGRTAVHHAASAGSVAGVDFILKRTPGKAAAANLLRKTDKKGLTAISLAASRGHEGVVVAILNAVGSSTCGAGGGGGAGAGAGAATAKGDDTATAAAAVAAATAVTLDASGATVLCREGLAAVHHAARAGHEGVVNAMLTACGAAAMEVGEARDDRGRTPMHHAAIEGQIHVQSALERVGCDRLAEDKDGQTPAQLGAANMGKGGEGGRNSFMNM